jgi:hypothetical protein
MAADLYEGYLFCPNCDKQHIDVEVGGHASGPHEKHRCLFCGFWWTVSPFVWGVAHTPAPRMPCLFSSYGRVKLLDGTEATTTTVVSVMMQIDEMLYHGHKKPFLDLVFTARGLKPRVAPETATFLGVYYRIVLLDGAIQDMVKRIINCAVVDDGNGGLNIRWPVEPAPREDT